MKQLILTLILAVMAFPVMAQEAVPALENGLTPVDAEYVCMVNDTAFDKPQIPVEVNEKTYYGCCMMCKERLTKDAAIRSAVDPVSGNEIDKAEAVIGTTPDKTVFYFESEENMKSYVPEEAPEEGDHGDHDHSPMSGEKTAE